MVNLQKVLTKVLTWLNTPLKVSYVDVDVVRAENQHASITPPAISGYSFLAWLTAATIGWIAAPYINQAESSVWIGAYNGTPSTSTGKVRCYALYVKNR